jgi:hypothetical protein
MNLPPGRPYRLVPRGGPGLSCDVDGVAFGDVSLVRVWSCDGRRPSAVRPPDELSEILRLAYGAQSPAVVQRCYRGLKRTTAQLEAGDLARASIEAVMIGFPDLTPPAMAKLSGAGGFGKSRDRLGRPAPSPGRPDRGRAVDR